MLFLLLLFINLKGRGIEKHTESKFPSTLHSPKIHSSQACAWQKPGAGKSIEDFHKGGEASNSLVGAACQNVQHQEDKSNSRAKTQTWHSGMGCDHPRHFLDKCSKGRFLRTLLFHYKQFLSIISNHWQMHFILHP